MPCFVAHETVRIKFLVSCAKNRNQFAEMSTIKISVIIPVYNAAAFCRRCIQSVLAQSLSEIEIILVNDGSTDDSLNMLREFEQQDHRVVVINSNNCGVSAARNKGLAIANGEWIAFADADDRMEPQMLQELYDAAIRSNAGMAVCNVMQATSENHSAIRLNLKDEIISYKNKAGQAIAQMMSFKFDYANWNKLYRADIIRQNTIRFDEHIHIGEDLLYNLYYLHYIDSIVCVNKPLYHYHIHQNSAMAQGTDKRVEQYNLQFKAYRQFAAGHKLKTEWEMFRKAMARGFYNSLVPVIIKNIQSQKLKRADAVKLFKTSIAGLDAEIFYYPQKKIGLQGFKKLLLETGKLALFSKIVGTKHF